VPRLTGLDGRPTGERLDLPDERRDVDGAIEEPAPLVRHRVLGPRERVARLAEEHDVDALRVRQLAEPVHRFERPLGVGVDQHHARPLHGDAREEHRHRHIDDHVPARAERLRDALGLRGRVADEDRGRWAPRDLFSLPSAPQWFVLALRFAVAWTGRGSPAREEYSDALAEPREEDAAVDEREDDEGEEGFAVGHAEDHGGVLPRAGWTEARVCVGCLHWRTNPRGHSCTGEWRP
jgi:hypothetical protein